MRGGNPRRKGERGKFEGELFSVLHSCRSHLEGEAGPSEVLSWKLFCSTTGESCDVTWSFIIYSNLPSVPHPPFIMETVASQVHHVISHDPNPTVPHPPHLNVPCLPPYPNATPIPYVVLYSLCWFYHPMRHFQLGICTIPTLLFHCATPPLIRTTQRWWRCMRVSLRRLPHWRLSSAPVLEDCTYR